MRLYHSSTAQRERREIEVTSDKPGRRVLVAADKSEDGLVLMIGFPQEPARGETEWTWLTGEEAREVARALNDVADASGG